VKYTNELVLKFSFEASHSLSGYETPHPHIWKIEIAVKGEPIQGKILDIVQLRSGIQKIIEPLASTYLNSNLFVSPEVREFPTCETLSNYFAYQMRSLIDKPEYISQNSSVRLSCVQVAICEMDMTEMGATRLTFV
jgi:6-pyruvoyl-tetrahydropterin synthase